MQITSNCDEHTCTVERASGVKLDFCSYRSDQVLIIEASDQYGELLDEIVLSSAEVRALLDYLLDARTLRVFT